MNDNVANMTYAERLAVRRKQLAAPDPLANHPGKFHWENGIKSDWAGDYLMRTQPRRGFFGGALRERW